MNATLERHAEVNPYEFTPESELELAEARLMSARTEWAQVSSRNRDRMIRRRIDGYNDIRDEYNLAVQDYGRLSQAEAVEQAEGDREVLSAIVAQYTMQEHLALRQESERFTDSKKIRKFARKFGEWMNRGNLATKIGKGIAVGGAVAAAVAIAPAGAAVAAGTVLAARAGVSYLRGSNHEDGIRDLGDGTLTDEALMTEASAEQLDDLFARMQQKASDTYKSDNKEVQQKVAKSTRRGLGLAAFTTVLGGTVGMAAHGMFVPSASANDDVLSHQPTGFADASHEPVQLVSQSEAGHQPVGFAATHESGLTFEPTARHEPASFIDTADHESVGLVDDPTHEPVGFVEAQASEREPVPLLDTTSDHAPVEMNPEPTHEVTQFVEVDATPNHEPVGFVDTDSSTGHEPVSFVDVSDDTSDTTVDAAWAELSHAARYVECGEGGFQTLKEMGVPEHKWESIWKDAGERLHGQGKTYLMEDGRWGWDREMRLTDNDLRILTQAAERQGVTV